jgi:hypothetical protein
VLVQRLGIGAAVPYVAAAPGWSWSPGFGPFWDSVIFFGGMILLAALIDYARYLRRRANRK